LTSYRKFLSPQQEKKKIITWGGWEYNS